MRFAHRRVRRRDFAPLVELFAACGQATPPAERAALRRFRNIVADLGVDPYVAVERGRVIGFVHVVYTRHFATGTRARIVAWLVHPERRRQGVGAALLALATERARRHGCASLEVAADAIGDAATLLADADWQPAGVSFRIDLGGAPGQIETLPEE